MKLGENIRQNRIKSGMTQEQLASRLCVTAQAISKWENGIAMPDISLLPIISETFGISIDDLFDLTIEQKMSRIENRIEIEEHLSDNLFNDYRNFLENQLSIGYDREKVLSLFANLYHKRMESDSKIVSKYAKEAIMLNPAKKDCQWLLNKAEGHAVWDWNFFNHTKAIEFYKKVIESDREIPKSSLPYYYLIDNLLADGRSNEAEQYLAEFSILPSANPVLCDVYPAYIELTRHNVKLADEIIENCICNHPDDKGYLFEAAQYYARKCEYEKAIKYYERSWEVDVKPRFTDAQQAIAIINQILGNKEKARAAYDVILSCLREEWGYSKSDAPYLEVEKEILNL